jgi:hypothetical protein
MPSPTPSPAPPPVTCASPPNNGRFLSGYLKAGSGHTIEFRNEQENDLVAKVRNAKSGRVAGSFFVSAKSTALFEGLPDGRYVIQYATGGRLAPDCRSFLEVLAVLQYRDVETLSTRYRKKKKVIRERRSYRFYSGNLKAEYLELSKFNAE